MDEVAGKLDDQGTCILCTKPTQSHAVLIKPNPESHSFDVGTVEDMEETLVSPLSLCHSCYVEFEGDAELIAEAYEIKFREMNDAAGLDFENQLETMFEMIENDEYMLCVECGWLASSEFDKDECPECGGDVVLERGRDALEGNEYTL